MQTSLGYAIATQERTTDNKVLLKIIEQFPLQPDPNRKESRRERKGKIKKIATSLGLKLVDPKTTPLKQQCTRDRQREHKKRQREAQKRKERLLESLILEDNLKRLNNWYELQKTSESIALGRLIRYLNKYGKTFPKYKQRSKSQQKAVELIYSLKDSWILKNKENCIAHCKSSEESHYYVDWEELHYWQWSLGEWQDTEDYMIKETTSFYAYVFCIEGEEFRFHSMQVLFDEDKEAHPNWNSEGSTEALKENEKIVPLSQACAMAAILLDEWEKYSGKIRSMIGKKQKNRLLKTKTKLEEKGE